MVWASLLRNQEEGMTTPSRIRCAIYTRKSSEEGLEQSFNSLDAQTPSGKPAKPISKAKCLRVGGLSPIAMMTAGYRAQH